MEDMRDDNNPKPKTTQFTRRDALLTGAGAVAAVGVLSEANAAPAQATSATETREALKKENELLDELARAAMGFRDKQLTEQDVAYALVSHWASYFEGWRDINQKLIDIKEDDDLDKALEKEMVRLGRFSGQITEDDGEAGVFYLQRVFGNDIQDTASLITK